MAPDTSKSCSSSSKATMGAMLLLTAWCTSGLCACGFQNQYISGCAPVAFGTELESSQVLLQQPALTDDRRILYQGTLTIMMKRDYLPYSQPQLRAAASALLL